MARQVKKVEEEKDVKKTKKNPKKKDSKVKEVKKEEKKVAKIEKEEVVASEAVNNETKSNKKKGILGTILVIVSILLIVLAFVVSIIETNEKSKYYNEISYAAVSELMNDDEINIIYWASPNCSYCSMFTPIVKNVSYENKLTFNYLNTSVLTDDQYAVMYDYFTKYDEAYASKNLGTPSLILVKNNEIVDISVGALSEDELVKYLKDKELIK